MSYDALFLGVDGGGTKTEFVCIDADGVERVRHRTGTTYHLEVGFDRVVAAIEEGIAAVCATGGFTRADLTHVFFGLPAFGEDRVTDALLNEACGRILGHGRYRCGNDMICGWAGSLGCDDGINIVAGTGSIGYGEHGERTARAGGWGEIFGDEGSAHWIAIEGLAAFSRMSDGRLPKGSLHARFQQALGLEHDIDLCQRIMGPPAMPRGQIAALAPLVSQSAGDGDAAALAILHRAADHLGDIAIALRGALAFPPEFAVPLSWSGSILGEAEPVRRHFMARIAAAGGFEFVAPRHTPAYGAASYALRLAKQAADRLGS